MYALGIDLGTTFTAAAIWRDGRAEIAPLGSRAAAIPSVVLLRQDETFLIGETANRRALTEPDRVAREFKRRLGDPTPILLGGAPYSALALTGRLLRSVVDEVGAREGGPPSSIAVCHPANWGGYKTDLLHQAVRMASLDRPVSFVTEPEAAAVFYAQQQRIEPGDVVAVYDLGGGTFDAAVLRKTRTGFEILGQPEGIERLGGIDFDAAVFSHVSRALAGRLQELDEDEPAAIAAVARLREECTDAKEALSSDTDVTIPVLLPNLATEVRLTRAELETMVRPALYDTIEALKRALRSAAVQPEQLHSVLLVGGSSRMPIVAQLVGAELGRPVAVDAHPKHAVALGAAWVASGSATAASARGRSAVPDGSPVPVRAPERSTVPGPSSVPGGAPAPGGVTVPGPSSVPGGGPAPGGVTVPGPSSVPGGAPAPGGVTVPGPSSVPGGAPAPGGRPPRRPVSPVSPVSPRPAAAEAPAAPPAPAARSGDFLPPLPGGRRIDRSDNPAARTELIAPVPPTPAAAAPVSRRSTPRPRAPRDTGPQLSAREKTPPPRPPLTVPPARPPWDTGPQPRPPRDGGPPHLALPPGPPPRGGRLRTILIALLILAGLAAIGSYAGVALAKKTNGTGNGAGTHAAAATTPAGTARPGSSRAATPAAPARTIPADEQCTQAIRSNPRWVCLTKAVLANGKITIDYQADFGGSTPNVHGGFHVHIYGGDGTNPPDNIEGRQAGDQAGRWYVEDQNPSIRTVDSNDFRTAIGPNAKKVCARIANGLHELVPDLNDTFHTGNCVPIQRA